jgi:hypothetical protein
MKGKLIIFITTCMFGIAGCALDVNDADPHTSESIKESKKNVFFISEYTFEQNPKVFFDISEVWQEEVWHYKVRNIFSVEKVKRYELSWILFTLKDGSKHSYENFNTEWEIKNPLTNEYVGFMSGRFAVSLNDCKSPDSIKLNLTKSKR